MSNRDRAAALNDAPQTVPAAPSRREFLSWSLMAAGGSVATQMVGCGSTPGFSDTLREPSVLRPVNGVASMDVVAEYVSQPVALALASAATSYPGPVTVVDTALRRYAGGFPAPTVRLRAGDTLRIRLVNRLPASPKGQSSLQFLNYQNSTNLHFHGLHVSPEKEGDLYGDYVVDMPEAGVLPGAERQHQIVLPSNHPPGIFWYHPHLHGSSGAQVASGMFGAIVVEDPANSIFDPATVRERIIFVHKYSLNASGRTDSFYDSALTKPSAFLLNGSYQPTIVMRPGEIQVWHFINSATFYPFNPVLDGHTMQAFLRDGDPIPGGLLPINAETAAKFDPNTWASNIQAWPGGVASPGSRISVLVKASDIPGDYPLRSALSPWTPFALLPQYAEVVARVRVQGEPVRMELPSLTTVTAYASRYDDFTPITNTELAENGGVTRNLVLGIVPVTDARVSQPLRAVEEWSVPTGDEQGPAIFSTWVFGAGTDQALAPFQSSSAMAQTVKLNDVEEWTVASVDGFPHPFHIHVNDSYVVKINGEPLAEPFWADTIAIPPKGSITFRIRFKDFKGKFVWHCHALEHEDLGMMQLVEVV
jgi:FtsP/CotA-like multicopper oxidase with cupredoxin domain